LLGRSQSSTSSAQQPRTTTASGGACSFANCVHKRLLRVQKGSEVKTVGMPVAQARILMDGASVAL
jgi:hypothetical protein